MKQYRITSADIIPEDDNDCYLLPDDPIHYLKTASQLGGLGSQPALAKYLQATLPDIAPCTKGKEAREQDIKPGTPQWFQHWYGRS
jgi:hypothetical protein